MQRPAPPPEAPPEATPGAVPEASPAAPRNPPPAPAAPLADAAPAALWAATLERLADRPSLVWLRHLRLEKIEGEVAVVSIAAGQREVLHIATPQRLEIVAATLGELRGRRTRIDLRAQPAAAADPSADDAAPEAGPPGRPTGVDRRAALQLPLVRAAMQAFPDAMLIDAREETADDVPPNEGDSPSPTVMPDPDPLDDDEEL